MKKETLNTMCSQVRKWKEQVWWCCQQSLLVIVCVSGNAASFHNELQSILQLNLVR